MSEWKSDRSGKYLSVVYEDVQPGIECGLIVDHPKVCGMSWSHALNDVDRLMNRTQSQHKPLVVDKAGWYWISENECIHESLIRKVEQLHGIK